MSTQNDFREMSVNILGYINKAHWSDATCPSSHMEITKALTVYSLNNFLNVYYEIHICTLLSQSNDYLSSASAKIFYMYVIQM